MAEIDGQSAHPLDVLIVGAGLGGLACAIACRRQGLSVTVLERAQELGEKLGAVIQLASNVISVDDTETYAILDSGTKIYADVIVGADGLNSVVRKNVLGYQTSPSETGDLAYRATIPIERVKVLNEPSLQEAALRAWVGPGMHAVLYPVRNREVFNLVLLCPDDLPHGVATEDGNIHEMRNLFKGWDPRLTAMIAQVDNVLKWKICHMKELDTWCRGSIALLGDACHPTLPYQAQGAAMAVEDGAALGILLGKFSKAQLHISKISEVLRIYELMRKARTTVNVEGAIANQSLYHMEGAEAEARDEAFAGHDWDDDSGGFRYGFGNLRYMKQLMGFDTIADANRVFDEWLGVAE